MCDASIVLQVEYEDINYSYTSWQQFAVISGSSTIVCGICCYMARSSYPDIFNCWIFATSLSALIAIVSTICMKLSYRKLKNKWDELRRTGCVTVSDPRHARFRQYQPQQQHQQHQQRYENTMPSQRETQPLTQNSIDVNQLVQGYASQSDSMQITSSGIQFQRNQQQQHVQQQRIYDAEYVDAETRPLPQQPQRQLPPLRERAIVRRQAENTKIRRRER